MSLVNGDIFDWEDEEVEDEEDARLAVLEQGTMTVCDGCRCDWYLMAPFHEPCPWCADEPLLRELLEGDR